MKYGSTSVQVSDGQTINLPANVAVTITFPEVEGYLAPDPISFTHSGGLSEKTGTYQCELLTVNVTADSGTPTGFEVTISKQETVGVATKYTRLEYIENTGSAYIDSGFIPNQDTRVVMDFQSTQTTGGWPIFGSRQNSSSKAYTFGSTSTNNCWLVGYNSSSVNSNVTEDNLRHTADKNKNVCYLDGVQISSHAYASFTSPGTMRLCNFYAGDGDNNSFAKIRIYSCQIYDNGNLVRDYVPALRSDGIAGLYDAANDIFYASKGADNFVAGVVEPTIVATQTSVTGTYKIPFDASYTVKANQVGGYDTPQSITRIASEKSYTVIQQYTVIKVKDLSLYDVYGNPINRSTANCYVVREPGQYKFPLVYGNAIKNGKVNTAAFTNNGGTYSHDFVTARGGRITQPYIGVGEDLPIMDSVVIMNSDVENVITDVKQIDGDICKFIQFTITEIPATGGNIILRINNLADIAWSWHIWLWPHDLSPVEITNSTGVKYNIMPVNLASKYDSDGVHIKNWFYQWGRKDPMLLPSAWNSTTDHSPGSIIKESIAVNIIQGIIHPTTFYYNSASPYNWFGDMSYYNLWDAACTGIGNSDNDTVKTVYDPCPVGWKIPNGNTFTGLKIISKANGIVKMARYSGDTVGVGFPMSGSRFSSDGSLDRIGSRGYVWLSSAYSQTFAYVSYFDSDSIHIQSYSLRADGFSVRPVQDDITKVDEI